MRVNLFLTGTLAAAALLVASCSTQKMAQNNSADDVYNTVAQAKVYKYAPPAQTAQIDTSRVDPSYQASNPNYDMDYASRIDRFYYGSPNRVYFDDYYNFYGYNSWYNPFDVGFGFNYGWGFSRWNNPFNYWGYYGSPYYWNTWGPYSYYNPWHGGWGGGYWGGGYWGNGGWGGGVIVRNDNYRPRPTRAGEGGVRPNGRFGTNIPSRGNANVGGRPTRPESYNPTTNGAVRRPESTTGSTSSRPTRESSRPSTPQRESYTPPRTYTPPPSSSGSGSSSSGSSSSGGSRPTRGGGRG
jgi:hypothetical protein